MTYDLSILIPGIRTYNWQRLVKSCELACKNYTYEVVFVGPFPPPPELNLSNIQHIQTWGSPTYAAQMGIAFLSSALAYHTVDDCIFAEDSIDLAMDLYKAKCCQKDMINMTYRDDVIPKAPEFWNVGSHPEFSFPTVDPLWLMSMQFIVDNRYFVEIGGFDTRFEYLNHAIHDFIFRAQRNGSKVYNSPAEVCMAGFMPGTTIDHAPVHYAQTEHDEPLFNSIYQSPEANTRIAIDFNNWQQADVVWKRRFPGKLPATYEEMQSNKEYRV